jgi:hypothetical protein
MMITDKDIRDIQAYNKGLLPPHREERFKERLINDPELKAKFDELNPMLRALEEINFENKIREIITKKVIDYEPVMQEMIAPQKVVPIYKRMWVYVAAACVVVFVVVGIDYRKNLKLREELLAIERKDKEKAHQDSLKAVLVQQKQLKVGKDSTGFDRPQKNVIVKKNDSIDKRQAPDNQLNNPTNEKLIVDKPVPENKRVENKNNLEVEENENSEVSSLNGQNQFTKTVDIVFIDPFYKTRKYNTIEKAKVNVRYSKNTLGTSNQIGSVVFMEQTNTFSLSIFDKEVFNLLRKNDISATQKTEESFLLDLGDKQLEMNTKTRIIK